MKKTDRGLGVVEFMIDLYYDRHQAEEEERLDLKDYVAKKLALCPHGDDKPFCSSCKIHCYDKAHRAKIKKVMKYAGPRMIFYTPGQSLKHLIEKIRRS